MALTKPSGPNEIALLIGGELFRFWSEIDIGLSLDSYATCDVVAPYEAERKEFRRAFKPFSFVDFDVTRGGKPLFTGTLVSVEPETLHDKKSVRASGYAKPGVLSDCVYSIRQGDLVRRREIVTTFVVENRRKEGDKSPPTFRSTLEREFLNMTLRDIALVLTEPFGVDVEFRGEPGAAFDKVKIERTQKVHEFLEGLAQQRGFVMSNTPEGALLFWKSIRYTRSSDVRAYLKTGQPPVVSVRPSFQPQEYFSEIEGLVPANKKREQPSAVHTLRNPWLSKFRPTAIDCEDTLPGDLPAAVTAELGRMIGNAASWSVLVPTWLDPQGALWEPNTIIVLEAHDAMIYRPTPLLIRNVQLHVDADSESATLDVVLPGVFSDEGKLPQKLPWDE
jgi:prophage tail gpP-like protein